jgi:hypothetical protein
MKWIPACLHNAPISSSGIRAEQTFGQAVDITATVSGRRHEDIELHIFCGFLLGSFAYELNTE